MTLCIHLMLVVFGSYGLAVLLVEKRRQWPVRRYNLLLKKMLGKIHRRAPNMLNCTVCTSFWTPLLIESGLLISAKINHAPYDFHWLWPLSGFITAGLSWSVIQIMNALDPI